MNILVTGAAGFIGFHLTKALLERGDNVSYVDVLKNVQERDFIDSNREDSPLVQAEDAIALDNSNMTLEDQFDKILQLAKMAIEDIE